MVLEHRRKTTEAWKERDKDREVSPARESLEERKKNVEAGKKKRSGKVGRAILGLRKKRGEATNVITKDKIREVGGQSEEGKTECSDTGGGENEWCR